MRGEKLWLCRRPTASNFAPETGHGENIANRNCWNVDRRCELFKLLPQWMRLCVSHWIEFCLCRLIRFDSSNASTMHRKFYENNILMQSTMKFRRRKVNVYGNVIHFIICSSNVSVFRWNMKIGSRSHVDFWAGNEVVWVIWVSINFSQSFVFTSITDRMRRFMRQLYNVLSRDSICRIRQELLR